MYSTVAALMTCRRGSGNETPMLMTKLKHSDPLHFFYVCNHGSPNGERDTASPRGRYGEHPQRDSCLKIHI